MEQGQLVEKMNELTQLDGNVANKLQRSMDKKARVETCLRTMGKKTLQKWVHRFIDQGLSFAFTTWKKTIKNLNHRESLITSLKK